MDAQTALLFVAPALPVVVSVLDHWHKWQKEGKTKHAYLTVGLLGFSLIVAWVLVYIAGEQRQAQLAQVRRDAAAQTERLSEQLHFQKQDLEARLFAQEDRSRLIAEGCISNPKLRDQAKAIHPKLQRGATETVHIDDTATAVVTRGGEKQPEPRPRNPEQ